MAKTNKQEKSKQSRREFYGFEPKRDLMDYVFWGLCAVAALLVIVALVLHL